MNILSPIAHTNSKSVNFTKLTDKFLKNLYAVLIKFYLKSIDIPENMCYNSIVSGTCQYAQS